MYVGEIPRELEEPVGYAVLMQELGLAQRGALVIGLRLPNGEEMINPPRTTAVPPGTLLIYLSELPILDAPV